MATVDQALLGIDREIIGLHSLSIRDDGSRTSIPPPVFRLPPELLAKIFVRCAADHYNIQYFLARVVPSWVNVSYVCRYWREVALDCPTLWAYHFVASLRWTEELLARSQQAGLKVCLKFRNDGSVWWMGSVERLLSHTERIQELVLLLPEQKFLNVLSMLSSPAPRLQRLQMWMLGIVAEQSFLPFCGDTPALHTLDLRDCTILWHSFRLTAVTSLHLSTPEGFRKRNILHFLAGLRCMQELRQLHIYGVLDRDDSVLSSAVFRTFQTFSLPHLTRLSICEPLSAIIVLLSCVDVPMDTLGRLECYCEDKDDSSPDYYILLASLLAQRFGISEDRALSTRTIRSLVISFTFVGETVFLFSSRERHYDASKLWKPADIWHSDVPLQLVMHWSRSMWARSTTIEEHINDICCTTPLTTVQTLHAISPLFTPTLWKKMLGHLRGLRYIKLSVGNMPDFSVLSAPDLVTHEDEENWIHSYDRDHMLVPDLEELELFWINFAPGNDSILLEPAITQIRLFDALATRGLPGGRLVMKACLIGGHTRPDMVRSWDGLIRIIENTSWLHQESDSECDSDSGSEDG